MAARQTRRHCRDYRASRRALTSFINHERRRTAAPPKSRPHQRKRRSEKRLPSWGLSFLLVEPLVERYCICRLESFGLRQDCGGRREWRGRRRYRRRRRGDRWNARGHGGGRRRSRRYCGRRGRSRRYCRRARRGRGDRRRTGRSRGSLPSCRCGEVILLGGVDHLRGQVFWRCTGVSARAKECSHRHFQTAETFHTRCSHNKSPNDLSRVPVEACSVPARQSPRDKSGCLLLLYYYSRCSGAQRARARRAFTALAKPSSSGSVMGQEMQASVMLWP